MGWFHEEEADLLGPLMDYVETHREAPLLIRFPDGESYICTYLTDYESENSGELDIEMDDPRYDEFYQVALTITTVISGGPRGSGDALALDYRDFPASVIDADTGAVIYPAPSGQTG